MKGDNDMNNRPETGPMKFGDDWTGVFIRGDNALMYYAPALHTANIILGLLAAGNLDGLLEFAKQNGFGIGALINRTALLALENLMNRAMESTSPEVQKLVPFNQAEK